MFTQNNSDGMLGRGTSLTWHNGGLCASPLLCIKFTLLTDKNHLFDIWQLHKH